MKEYHASQEKEARIFGDSSLVEVGELIAALEQRQSKLAKSALAPESKEWSNEDARSRRGKLYVVQLKNATTSGILKASEERKATALTARLAMALGGGLALVAPMPINVTASDEAHETTY